MAQSLTIFDPADYLINEGTIAAFLTEALESNDAREIAQALSVVARARGGVAQLARDAGLTVDDLTRALNESESPDLGTILKITHALGIKLSASIAA